MEHFDFGTEGIYGTPIYVSAAYIFIFVVFAAFLERAGMLKLFNDFALGLVICRDALAQGARNALPVGVACAVVGVVIGTLTLTGTASTFISIGESNLFLSLVLTMLTCLVLGMGIPTIPNYIITSSLAGPALLKLGVPLLVSHMFVFYFGIMPDLAPVEKLTLAASGATASPWTLCAGETCLELGTVSADPIRIWVSGQRAAN